MLLTKKWLSKCHLCWGFLAPKIRGHLLNQRILYYKKMSQKLFSDNQSAAEKSFFGFYFLCFLIINLKKILFNLKKY